MIAVLAGGVGGARFANGLAALLPPGALTVIVNVGDDFDHLGLRICPDLDTVTYTLAGLNNRELGWGQVGETWSFMDALRGLGGPDWFNLGDRDLATHVLRTHRLNAGEPLSAIVADIAQRRGIAQRILPVTDDPLRSKVDTDEGELDFQDYFVRRRCEPVFRSIRFAGGKRRARSRPRCRRCAIRRWRRLSLPRPIRCSASPRSLPWRASAKRWPRGGRRALPYRRSSPGRRSRDRPPRSCANWASSPAPPRWPRTMVR